MTPAGAGHNIAARTAFPFRLSVRPGSDSFPAADGDAMQLHTRRISLGAGAALAAALLFTWPAPARAQSGTSRRDERRIEMAERQRALRSLDGINAKTGRKEPDRRSSYQQVAQDFEQLQLRNLNLSGAAAAGPGLDYVRIREEAAEVRRRASRLKSALALPAVKGEPKQKKGEPAATAEALKEAIVSLDALVKSFVWNPVFQKPDVLDAENSARAGRELEDILRLSEQIKAAAEALGKRKGL